MNKRQAAVLVLLGLSVAALYVGLGLVVYRTTSSYRTARVGEQAPSSPGTTSTAAVTSTEKPLSAVEIAGDENETTCRVASFLSDIGYDVIAVRAATDRAGQRILAAHLGDAPIGAREILTDVVGVVSMYAVGRTPPFDGVSIVICSPQDEVLISAVALRPDIEAWLEGEISTDRFTDHWLIQPR